jgi:PAS domain S-box-containing protein
MSSPKTTYSLLETILADPQLLQRASTSASISLTVTLEIDSNGFRRIDHPQWRDGPMAPSSTVRASESATVSNDPPPPEPQNCVDEGFVPSRSMVTPGKRPSPDTEYRLVGKLGSGGTGIVYQAHQRAIDREVAVKVLRDELACDPIARQRFLVEARTIGSLDHPNVIALHELATGPSSELFYSMKRVDGTSWDHCVDDMTFEENLETLLRLCDAIRYAHSRELIHRDIKPENVMLGRFGEVLLADWGLALSLTTLNHLLHGDDAAGTASHSGSFQSTDSVSAIRTNLNSSFPRAHAIGGTPAYMAPELAAGDALRQSKRTDIYLLGALLYRIITGHPPHYGDNLLECIRRAAANEIRPSSIRSGWVDVAMKAMATDPDDRYSDVAAFAAALAREKEHERSVDLLRRAEKLMKKVGPAATHQDYGVAEALIREALDVWPGNRQAAETLVDLQTEHARSAAASGDYDLALELLHRAGQGDSELAARVKMKRDSRREQAIRESKFSRLFTQSPDAGLMTHWGDGEIIEANNMFQQLTGFEPSAVVGRKIIDLNLWACKERRARFVEVLSDSGHVADFETPLYHRDGRRLDVSLCASRVEMNGESYILTTMRDIGLRMQARQELDRSRQRLRDMQRLAQLGTWELNVATGKVRWSDETYKIAGLPTDHGAPDLQGYLQTVHPDDRGKLNAAIENTILYRTAYELRLRHARPDGGWNTVIARGQPMLGDAGQVTEIYGVVLDITRYAAYET